MTDPDRPSWLDDETSPSKALKSFQSSISPTHPLLPPVRPLEKLSIDTERQFHHDLQFLEDVTPRARAPSPLAHPPWYRMEGEKTPKAKMTMNEAISFDANLTLDPMEMEDDDLERLYEKATAAFEPDTTIIENVPKLHSLTPPSHILSEPVSRNASPKRISPGRANTTERVIHLEALLATERAAHYDTKHALQTLHCTVDRLSKTAQRVTQLTQDNANLCLQVETLSSQLETVTEQREMLLVQVSEARAQVERLQAELDVSQAREAMWKMRAEEKESRVIVGVPEESESKEKPTIERNVPTKIKLVPVVTKTMPAKSQSNDSKTTKPVPVKTLPIRKPVATPTLSNNVTRATKSPASLQHRGTRITNSGQARLHGSLQGTVPSPEHSLEMTIKQGPSIEWQPQPSEEPATESNANEELRILREKYKYVKRKYLMAVGRMSETGSQKGSAVINSKS